MPIPMTEEVLIPCISDMHFHKTLSTRTKFLITLPFEDDVNVFEGALVIDKIAVISTGSKVL